MKSFIRAHREYEQSLRMQRENQGTLDAQMWVGFLQRLDEGDFTPEGRNRNYKRGVEDTNALIRDYVEGIGE